MGRFSLTPPLWTLMVFKTNRMTPVKLMATPPAFFRVMGSFRAMAATNMVKIGVVEVMMEVSKGVVNLLDSR